MNKLLLLEGILGQVWYLIVSIPDICLHPYFFYSHEYRLARNTVCCVILSEQTVVGCLLGVPVSFYMSVAHCIALYTQ